ncbi:serine/threonine-protein kinase [Streptomyces sp. SP18CS02]|uniref:serine/threonine-protein kinase n=1 Tax=Streptomyces sp. SP18CS02 TaxID=3002531 RepID=UPI002E77FE7F|nr:serine/threonine-protein kinase [Streptomyces sp. SP18CS02]MEE1757421.1 serine/threonine-protein kinase [Streptomyces sp. SP18CS02]
MSDVTGAAGLPFGRPSGPIGQRIAHYEIRGEIGRGGMAVVYRAWDLRLERDVALKLLAPDLARDDTFRKRFAHESRVAAAIDHPHIVPVYEADEVEGVLYIAMRLVRGSDLGALLEREGALPVEQAGRIAVQVASALDAAHALDLVHRDVKPSNILVAEGTDTDHPEQVYLTDFGLMKKSLSSKVFTSVDGYVGTLGYMAPEQFLGQPVDGRCDLYSLACVVFEMLAGAPPYRREDEVALLYAHQFAPPPPLTADRPELPEAVDAVLAKALAKSPQERYDTCLGFVADLRAAAMSAPDGGGASRSRPQVPTSAGPPPDPPPWARPAFPGGL